MKNVGNKIADGFSLMALLCMVVILACNNGARKNVGEENKAKTAEDSFTVVYSKPVKEFKVRAVLKPYETDMLIMKAAITFEKDGKQFTLKTSCYGDTAFCKGRLDYEDDNAKFLNKYRNKTVKADYNEANKCCDVTTIYNIDEKEDLVTVHSTTTIIFIPQIPHYEFYLKSVLQKFFEARNEVTNEFMKSRPMVEHS